VSDNTTPLTHQVWWRSRHTGLVGHGQPTTKELAEVWAFWANRECGDAFHWVQEVGHVESDYHFEDGVKVYHSWEAYYDV
jgi:hypothetical protein